MKKIVSTLILGTLLAACGGGADEAPPAQPPAPPVAPAPAPTPPPPAPTADTTPAAPPPSPADVRMATAKGVGDAMNAHDAAKVAAGYATGAVVKHAGMPDVTGRDAIAASMQKLFDSYPDLKIGARRVLVKDDFTLVEWTMIGTNTGPGPMGAKSTGKPIGLNGASLTWFDGDGFIKEEHIYIDVPTLMSQLGLSKQKGRDLATLPTGAPEVHVAKGTPDEAKNADKVKAVDHAFETNDEKTYAAATADDISWDDLAEPAPLNGKKDAIKNFEMGQKAFTGAKLDCQVWTFDDWAAQECTFNAKNTGPIEMGPKTKLPATNKTVTFHGVDVMQLKDGKATHGWSYSNGLEAATQLGLVKPPKGPDAAKGAPAAAPKK